MQRRTVGRGLSAVLFTDIVGSTPIAAEMGNTRYGELVARHHRILRRLIGRFGGHEIDTAGDGFFVSFERPADAIRCAVEATESVRELGIELRAGVSFGEVETVSGKPGGLVVNTAARVMSVAGPGEVLVPSSVRDIVPGSGITFADHGTHQLKGLDGDYRLFKVTGVDGKEVVPPPEAEEAAERRREIFPSGAGRRGPLIAGLAAGALAVIVAATLLLTGGTPEQPSAPAVFENAIGTVDPETGRAVAEVALPLGTEKSGFDYTDHPFAVGEGGAWLLRPPVLLHLDPRHHEVREPPIQVGLGSSQTVVTGFDAVWVLSDRTVVRVNPATDESAPFLVIPERHGITTFNFILDRALWVSVSDGTLIRLDPRTQARKQVNTGLSVDRIAATTDAIWAVDLIAGQATPFDRDTLGRSGQPIDIEGNIDLIVGAGHDLWTLDRGVGTLTRIDTDTGHADVARVGMDPTDMAFGLGAVWVGDRGGSLYRVDPATLETIEIPIGAEVRGVAVDDDDGSLWVYVRDRTSD